MFSHLSHFAVNWDRRNFFVWWATRTNDQNVQHFNFPALFAYVNNKVVLQMKRKTNNPSKIIYILIIMIIYVVSGTNDILTMIQMNWGITSVQFKMVSMCLGRPIYAPPRLKFSQCCPWNSSSVGPNDDRPFSSSQGRSLRASSFYSSLSSRRSMVWCPWLCACR